MEWPEMDSNQRRDYIFREMAKVNLEAEQNMRTAVDAYEKAFMAAFVENLAKMFRPRISSLPSIPLRGTWNIHQAFKRHMNPNS